MNEPFQIDIVCLLMPVAHTARRVPCPAQDAELAADIKQKGQMLPIPVKKVGTHLWAAITGRRRVDALLANGEKTVWVVEVDNLRDFHLINLRETK
jgi:ParB-like chromosome segregation protein Spo0J